MARHELISYQTYDWKSATYVISHYLQFTLCDKDSSKISKHFFLYSNTICNSISTSLYISCVLVSTAIRCRIELMEVLCHFIITMRRFSFIRWLVHFEQAELLKCCHTTTLTSYLDQFNTTKSLFFFFSIFFFLLICMEFFLLFK